MNRILTLTLLFSIFAMSCEKPAGEGGNSTIRGDVKLEFRQVLTNPSTATHTVSAADVNVFIIYGDEVGIGDDIETNYKGEYEFKYLRSGKYTIYTYSEDTTGTNQFDPNRMPIIEEVEINEKGETVEVPTMTIYEDV